MITDRELDAQLAAAAGIRDQDLPALPADFLTALRSGDDPEPARPVTTGPASVVAARQLVTDARERRTSTRRRPARSRARLAAVLVATAVAAAALVFGWLPGSTPPSASAFAGYEYSPTPPSADQQQAQAQDCRDDMLAQGSTYNEVQRQEIAASTLVAADVRGSWSFTVLTTPDPENGTIGVFCLRNLNDARGFHYSGTTEGPQPAWAVDGIPAGVQMLYGIGEATSDGTEGACGEFGRIGPQVTSVSLDFAGGETAEATVNNGWYAVWWPDNCGPESKTLGRPTTVEYTTANGQVTTL
ncbi:MAG: hypothetical protein ACR2FG_14855, partial [Marmoricola sp.]